MGIISYAETENGDPRAFDTTWCVFDSPKNKSESYGNALKRASQKEYRIADSFPCFELWFLLHYKYTTQSFENCSQVESALQKFIPDYCKEKKYLKNIFRSLRQKLSTALENCKKLERYNQENNIIGGSNVHKLIAQILEMSGIE